MNDENKPLIVALSFLVLVFILFIFYRTPAKLDDLNDPFIVRKVQSHSGQAKYYGQSHQSSFFGSNPIILDKGRYTVGDTIYFPAQIK